MRDELRRPSPFVVLQELSDAGSTGELICALGASEVHVYLQAGRVAWGTDTEHPFAFGRRLMEVCGIDRARFTELVTQCRREKIALGESLVKKGVATREQARHALRHQASLAVRALSRTNGGDCAFFERKGFASYDRTLTFVLEELLEEDLRRPLLSAATAKSAAVLSHAGIARRLFGEVNGCDWAARWQGAQLLEQHTQQQGTALAQGAVRSLLHDDAVDFVAVRNGAGAILGATLDTSSDSVWCGVREDAPFGAAYAVFAQICELDRRSQTGRRVGSPARAHLLADQGTELGTTALTLMDRVPEVLGVCHLVSGEVSSLAVRTGTEQHILPRRLSSFAERLLTPNLLADGTRGGCAGYGMKTAVFGELELWTYGMELSSITGESLWLVTSRKVAQGFGWACLAAMVRELGAL